MGFVLLYAAFLAFIIIIAAVVICIFMLVFFLPYVIWRGRQNDKGLHLELSGDLGPGEELLNAAKWWISLITHKPAF